LTSKRVGIGIYLLPPPCSSIPAASQPAAAPSSWKWSLAPCSTPTLLAWS